MESEGYIPYVFCELPDINSDINQPIQFTQRLKYTCFDVSKNLIVFGATSGAIYVFNRQPLKFFHLVPNKEGLINYVKISPNEKYICFATIGGLVFVKECLQPAQSVPQHISKEHQGKEVTAIVWNDGSQELWIGDSTGHISILHITTFITKTFNTTTFTLMRLDSRIVQMELNSKLLLISTSTRTYVCDTEREQYRQIGQKLREGEYGACFTATSEKPETDLNESIEVDGNDNHNAVNDKKEFSSVAVIGCQNTHHLKIACARPGLRIWEAQADGTVIKTYQFKQQLRTEGHVVTRDVLESERLGERPVTAAGAEVQFSRLYPMRGYVFTYNKNGLFVIDARSGSVALWSSHYGNIKNCRVIDTFIYLLNENDSVTVINFLKVDKFIVTSFLDKKYRLCASLCAFYDKYLITNAAKLRCLNLLAKFDDVLIECGFVEECERIRHVLDEFANARQANAQRLRSGIYVVKNAMYFANGDETESPDEDSNVLQTFFQDLSLSVSDKLTVGTRKLKEKWDNFGVEKYDEVKEERVEPDSDPESEIEEPVDDAQKLYHHLRVFDSTNIDLLESAYDILSSVSEDVRTAYELLKRVETLSDTIDSKCSKLFLYYINKCSDLDLVMTTVVNDADLCMYFTKACSCDKSVSCECGYPLPNLYSSQTPQFSNVIDKFIELQWSTSQSDCYDICKKIPYMWRKVLYLRRNEDLKNLLILLLQMLDEDLLYTYLPHFTVDVWEKAIQLFATLKSNACLNCGAHFADTTSESTITWDNFGALMIKSIGGKNAVKTLKTYAWHIPMSGLSFAFYHACTLTVLFDKYDYNLRAKLTDAIYEAYKYPGAMDEVITLLKSSLKTGTIANTSLPFAVASKSKHWGLNTFIENPQSHEITWFSDSTTHYVDECDVRELTVDQCYRYLDKICPNKDCLHCSLPLNSAVLLRDGGLWVFVCGHTFHGPCLRHLKVKLCPMCVDCSNTV